MIFFFSFYNFHESGVIGVTAGTTGTYNIGMVGNPQGLEVRTQATNPAEDFCLSVPSFLSSPLHYYCDMK